MKLSDALCQYKQYLIEQKKRQRIVERYLQDLTSFRLSLEKHLSAPAKVGDVTTSEVEDFLKYVRQDPSYNPERLRWMIAAIKSFFQYSWEQNLCGPDVACSIEYAKCIPVEQEDLSEEEVAHFIEEINHQQVRMLITTMLHTGMRVSEALALRVEDIDRENGWIYVESCKSKRSRKLPISDTLRQKLESYLDRRSPSEHLFGTKKTGRLSRSTVQAVLRVTGERLGTKKRITSQVFRYSFARQLLKKGVGISTISRLMGYADYRGTAVLNTIARD